ncbi:hypothetical protein VQ366_004729 [Salmonella enterica]|nr:hypothetical protein [Salmonella enterica]EMD3454732.1 hypothetical protein [Salmonella enterica]EMD3628140.1 hypothetical protein [Salmonella enterica]EMD3712013.1 hypothetical protein [Salmonella enterica]EMD3747591.1 hypothetical protein [Salmonella enterica]
MPTDFDVYVVSRLAVVNNELVNASFWIDERVLSLLSEDACHSETDWLIKQKEEITSLRDAVYGYLKKNRKTMNNFKGFKGCKDFDEVVKFCTRENRKADIKEAEIGAFWHVSGVMDEVLKREGPGIYGMDKENTTLALSVAELEKEIHRAYFAGLKKVREQGGLEPLFEGEEV